LVEQLFGVKNVYLKVSNQINLLAGNQVKIYIMVASSTDISGNILSIYL